jgi:ribosomal protein S18 acetylase RimI-like enzyme
MNRIILDGDPRDFLDWREGSGGTVEIFDIAIGSERRTGKGRNLVEKLFAIVPSAPTVYAITRAGNEIAQQFYEALLFDRVGVLRRFYRDKGRVVDAVIYGRSPQGPV